MKLFWGVFSSVGIIILFGWSLIEFYQFTQLIASQGLNPPWSASLNLLPFLLFSLFSLITFMIYKKKNKSLLFPAEIEENDEREQFITSKATRFAYISIFYSFPFITILMLLYPFISESFPYYPIVIMLIFPISQILVYAVAWQRAYTS
ncbi:hypothetical protein [Geomicrobium sp. JCM 19038]|uniref:hypothetical protein n=1 Tax=Geomicrobium sp. JCM 19038 TaxID=1460635 RepID=UPI0005A8E70F|nr:hypothetical protein [Geomicrobium sp. JCM 19038]